MNSNNNYLIYWYFKIGDLKFLNLEIVNCWKWWKGK